MNIPLPVLRRIHWINLPAAVLVALLQRTPVLRHLASAGELVAGSRLGQLVRSAFTLGALGALHSRAGATTFIVSPDNPVRGTVGAQLSVAFTYTGTPSAPQHFQVSGELPPGMSFVPSPIGGTVRSGNPAIVGTPTQAGTFTVNVQGFGTGGNGTPVPITFIISGNTPAAPPSFTTQPSSRTVNVGEAVTFTVEVAGSPTPSLQWQRNGTNILGANGTTLAIASAQVGDAGNYTVVAANASGTVTSSVATLTVNSGGGSAAPSITAQPVSQTIASGSTVAFSITVTGSPAPLIQWRRDGVVISGATSPTLVLTGANAVAGTYTATATNPSGSATSAPATLTIGAATEVARLVNLAIRTNAGTGTQSLIVGYVVGGGSSGEPKPLLIRGIGPTLAGFGVSGALGDPEIVVRRDSTMISSNDNWGGNAQVAAAATQVQAFPLQPTTADAALVASTAPGGYTVQVSGRNNTTGVALAEIYDAASSAPAGASRLINVSARTQVGTGGDILIAGFVLSGTAPRTVLIRAIGPRLTDFGVTGVLVDPKLQLLSDSAVVRENDDWGGDAQVAAVAQTVSAFPLTNPASKDAIMVVTLPAGAYTAQVSGVNGGTGVALVEVYEVP